MIDLNSKSMLTDRIAYLIDKNTPYDQQNRDYLGASIVGHECERHVQYSYQATQGKIQGKPFEPRILRIFDRGNLYEERARTWLKQAGFMFGRTKAGKSFSMFEGKLKGHVDGVITGFRHGEECPIPLPALWENKCLGAKGFKKVSDEKLHKYSSTYYGQVMIYMKALSLPYCLFTAVNADTMEVYSELIPYNDIDGSYYVNRAQRVINLEQQGLSGERISKDRNYYLCKSMCNYRDVCWSQP